MESKDQKTKDLARAIRNVLANRGISTREFALLVGRDKRVVELWLNGMCRLNLNTLFHISEKLGLL